MKQGGHELGDQLLRQVADRLRALLRKADTVARLGSDDFAAVLLDIDDAESGATVAGKIVSAFQQPFLISRRASFRYGKRRRSDFAFRW